jgi:hypothetical protein
VVQVDILQQIGKDSINYILMGLAGGIFGNLRSMIEFLKQPTVTWPRGSRGTIFRLWVAILTEIFYRPLVGMAMAYAVDIHPAISLGVGVIAPALINLIVKEGPKLFMKYWEKKFLGPGGTGTGSASSNSPEPEPVKVVNARALDQETLKTLDAKAEEPKEKV